MGPMPYKDISQKREHNRIWMKSYNLRPSRIQSNSQIYLKRREELWSLINPIKVSTGCFFCGDTRPLNLSFHHKDPSTKSFEISTGGVSKSKEDLLSEIAKCVVLCISCHRRVHFWMEQNKGTQFPFEDYKHIPTPDLWEPPVSYRLIALVDSINPEVTSMEPRKGDPNPGK